MSDAAKNETSRIEAFSDGVFAIAVTLLILELKVPSFEAAEKAGGLAAALLAEWPSYLGFLTSFVLVLIMWINHHKLFSLIRRSDAYLLLLNGFLLLIITIVPFPTALIAEYLLHPEYVKLAAGIYSGLMLLMALSYNFIFRYALQHDRLIDSKTDGLEAALLLKKYRWGPAWYVVGLIVAYFNAWASIGISVGLALLFAIPTSHPPKRKKAPDLT